MDLKSQVPAVMIVLLVATLACAGVSAQAKPAATVESILDHSFTSMYNLRFEDAWREAEEAKAVDRTDPLPWIAQACAVLFQEFDRLHILRSDLFASEDTFSSRPAYAWIPERKKKFDAAIAQAEALARQRLARDHHDAKALFVLALASGLRGDDAAMITKHNLTALSYIKAATNYSDKLLALSPNYYDAYVGVGVGKYIIGGKAAPIRWLLRIGGIKGDQQEGLKDLAMAAEHGRFLAPFARIVLAFDDLRHKHRDDARKKLLALRDQFPGNPLFKDELARIDTPSSGTSGQ